MRDVEGKSVTDERDVHTSLNGTLHEFVAHGAEAGMFQKELHSAWEKLLIMVEMKHLLLQPHPPQPGRNERNLVATFMSRAQEGSSVAFTIHQLSPGCLQQLYLADPATKTRLCLYDINMLTSLRQYTPHDMAIEQVVDEYARLCCDFPTL